MQDLNDFYRTNPALFVLDNDPAGFRWINCISAEKCMLSFMRLGHKVEDSLVIVANFANIKQTFEIGVHLEGKFREVFNTDESRYGGSGRMNEGLIETEEREIDDFPFSYTVQAAPLSLMVFAYEPFTEEELENLTKRKEDQIKKRLADEIAAAKKKAQSEINKVRRGKNK